MEVTVVEKLPAIIRPAIPADEAFVFDSWLNSYRNSPFSKNIRTTLYFEEHRKLIQRICAKATVICAVNPEDGNHIYGWACAEPEHPLPVIHYVFVKDLYRGFGVARLLIRELKVSSKFAYTHDSGVRHEGGIYCPYLIMGG